MDRRAYIFSAVLHAVVLLLLFLKLPFLRARPITPPAIVPVEIVSISDITKSPPKKTRNREKAAKSKKETRKAAHSKGETKVDSAKTPKKKTKKKEQLVKPKPKKNSKAPPPLEKEKPKKVENDLKQQKKSSKKRTRGIRKKADDFSSVLQAVHEVKKQAPSKEETKEKAIESEHISDKLSLSELDALRMQLQKCWNVPAGALNSEDLAVKVRVTMGPDAIVQEVDILEKGRMMSDGYFRVAAESARRALLSPDCTPLQLPKDRYDQWQTFVITFNPKDLI